MTSLKNTPLISGSVLVSQKVWLTIYIVGPAQETHLQQAVSFSVWEAEKANKENREVRHHQT